MSIRFIFSHLFIGFCLLGCAEAIGQTNQVSELSGELLTLREKCDILADDPRNESALEVLLEYAKNTNAVDRLRSRAMAAYALTGLMNGNTNLYVMARASHARLFPDEKHLLKIDANECFVACQNCKGDGFVMGACPVCQGDDKCRKCNGRGVLMVPKTLKGTRKVSKGPQCPACGGSGRIVCRRCGGKNITKLRCSVCKGNPYTFKTPQKVIDDFALLVKGISKWISNEEIFVQQFNAAQSENDVSKRIQMMSSLLSAYSYRPEKTSMMEMIAADRAELAKRRAEKRDTEIQINREITALRALKKESRSPAAALKTISDYIEANPESEYRVELEAMRDDFAAQIVRKRDRRRLYWIGGGVLALLLGLSSLRFRAH